MLLVYVLKKKKNESFRMKHRWRLVEIKFIKANLDLTDKRLGEILRATTEQVKQVRKYYGIVKKSTRFRKGYKPWNKGLSLCSVALKNRRFQKGYTPWNKGMRTEKAVVVKGMFDFEPKYRNDHGQYWLKIII